ncbi:aspartate aminotransferase family protein [Neobacillus terrae]|uniref:aspartate aminotransferase family protein n=1 Tax=Neobacillus terrae TaxID=3034837 RepID=UPI001407ABF6|nr:aspartate aminotransferase family protein [Neobacillus terrae]NHM32660.1 aspartate aminotransferase family protein [Neobacillus terrae]
MPNSLLKTSAVMNTYSRFPLTLVKGKGSFVWDDKGEKYLDFTSGIAVCNLGHVPDAVYGKVQDQLQSLWHCSNLYHIPAQEKLAELLIQNSFGGQVFFCNSGAEANEALIKLARKHGAEKGGSNKIATFKQSFHGRTLATLSATGQEKIQAGFSALTNDFIYLEFNSEEALQQLKELDTSAVLLELVQGEGGVVPADQEWVNKLAEICSEKEMLLMIDEVQTGMGRTGTLFAFQQYGIKPDAVSLAKGLGSGFPIGAIIASTEAAKVLGPGTHGSTFGGNPLSATAGLATLEYMVQNNAAEAAQNLGNYLLEKLAELKSKHIQIKDVRGKGLLLGLVMDTEAGPLVNRLREEEKVLALTAGPNVLRILPPLTASKEECDQFIKSLGNILAEA